MTILEKKSNPLAVVISDVHYTLNTLKEADTAFRMAIDKAAELGVPLIDAGDVTDGKAILRAEVVKAILDTIKYATSKKVNITYLVGNHSLINQKGTEHALHFLRHHAPVISSPVELENIGYIPYQQSGEDFINHVKLFPKDVIIIGHQGTKGGIMGDYIVDPTAFDPLEVKDWRIFLGHYHAHYTLHNTVSIGSPYTTTYGEAKDVSKGFLVVYQDGSFERILTGLRRHTILDLSTDQLAGSYPGIEEGTPLWVKITGPQSEIDKVTRNQVARLFPNLNGNFKLDLIPLDRREETIKEETHRLTGEEIFDGLIDTLPETDKHKRDLKDTWRKLV